MTIIRSSKMLKYNYRFVIDTILPSVKTRTEMRPLEQYSKRVLSKELARLKETVNNAKEKQNVHRAQ